MSAEVYSASGNNTVPSGISLGGAKPLHRFIKRQPKIVGIITLIVGSSFFIISIAIMTATVSHASSIIPPVFLMAILFIICGILYIVAEHNPTKKTVTISLALSIVTLLVACWSILQIIPSIIHHHYYNHYNFLEFNDENVTETEVPEVLWTRYYEAMGLSLEVIYLFYSLVGVIIFIVMSSLAGAALRSTNSQAIIVMTTTAAETPVE